MITDDLAELTQKMLDTHEAQFPDLTIFYEGQDEEPDEQEIWCRFTINPDVATKESFSGTIEWRQSGTAVLQIMEPKGRRPEHGQLDRWDIAEMTGKAFQGFRGPSHKMKVKTIHPERNSDDLYNIVNLIISWSSIRSS